MRILLVEDDALTRELLANLLTARGHQVTQAGSAEGAVEFLTRGTFDVLVTDMYLPGASGADVLALGREIPRKIALTALVDCSVAEGVLLLHKPVQPERLVAVIEGESP